MNAPLRLCIGQPWPLAADGRRLEAVDLGPEHPARTGLLFCDAELDDGLLREVSVRPGWNHRSVEKLFEVRDYRQVLVLADRHDWQAPFTGELLVALACEQLMGLVPPERATWLRMLLAEHARVASHLAHLSFVAFRLDDQPLAGDLRRVREQGRRLLLAATGNRVHPMANRLGGLAVDLPAALVDEVNAWVAEGAEVAARAADAATAAGLGRGVAVVDAATCAAFGLGGPVALAAGIDDDLRRQGAYLAHDQLGEALAVETTGLEPDALGRLVALARQAAQSARVAASCRDRLATLGGPVDTPLSKIVKLPDAEAWFEVEAPWGRAGVLLVSRAERTPWRLALRTASMANVQALDHVLDGCRLDDVDVAAASLGWTSGDLDK